ncbi:Lrp/AsnC family transcriptional regulator [Enterovibrio nigricans]|uniref:Leucine-responsive regulatory protein n=1 Tax=Enterovibrio nigricans DSM 22720 TaxID=1121868 RepID=A0A1T4VZ69_9GAMM|nr:Lrp/AsnC ligand binding domain-containing protein [Enterovibrio nigricans]PKF49210.1 AsnC family transcriptional regulator [Enterovibrio nigricans]SKA69781.1 Lrp/AsnC family transcriptional regulator, leucine-responsive regulatory protein [Enterovibrio nigricans DSM 22720]
MAISNQISLDRIDIEILRILQDNGRLPIVELAKRVNLTTTPCSERVKSLEREGYISGYHAALSAEKLGLDVLIFIHVRLDQTNLSIFDKFAKTALLIPEIEECYSLSGDFDAMIKVRVKNIKEYQKFMSTRIVELPGVIQTRSEIVIAEYKRGAGINADLIAQSQFVG